MIESRDPAGCPHKGKYLAKLRTLFCLALAVLLVAPAFAQSTDPDDQYLTIYGQIQQADSLNASGKSDAALALYQKAQAGLEQLHKRYPNWNTKLIGFRMDYVDQKLEALTPKKATTGAPTKSTEGAATGAGSQVKLLSAGAEPRKALRLHPKPGDKQTLTMTIKMGIAMKMGATENPPASMPPITMTMETTVKEVAGDITYDMLLKNAAVRDDPGAQPQMAAAMKAVVGNMKEISATVTISDRGVKKDTQMNVAAGTDPQAAQVIDQVKQSFASISAPLPEEEVGPGARWELRTPLKSQGMNIDQTATYELVSLEGDVLTARSTVTQRAANQKIQSPAMPGMKIDMTQMNGQGSGTLTQDLGQVMPRNGKADYHADISMSMGTGAQKQTIGTKIDLNLQLEGK